MKTKWEVRSTNMALALCEKDGTPSVELDSKGYPSVFFDSYEAAKLTADSLNDSGEYTAWFVPSQLTIEE